MLDLQFVENPRIYNAFFTSLVLNQCIQIKIKYKFHKK